MRPVLLFALGLSLAPTAAGAEDLFATSPDAAELSVRAAALRDASLDTAARAADFAADRLPARIVRPVTEAAGEFQSILERSALTPATRALPRLEVEFARDEEEMDKDRDEGSLGARLAAQLRLKVPF